MQRLRNIFSYVVELAGLAALVYGLYLLGPPGAYIGGGVIAIIIAQLIGAER
jgi:hypothetical protein